MNWVAIYGGTCARCDGRIHPDADIIEWDDDHGDYAHVTCPDTLTIPTTGVCPHCHLTLPATGVCGSC